MLNKYVRKIAILIGMAIAASAVYVSPLRADDATAYLKQIAQNTTDILTDVSTLPNYISTMIQYALNVQKTDDSQQTKDMQGNFAATGSAIISDVAQQLASQPTFNSDLLGTDATKETLPNGNDLVYSTMLGQPLFNPDPRNKPGAPPTANPPYNYIKNAAGMSLSHTLPRFNWRGAPTDLTKYTNYYNTIMAVESYNGYILSNQLVELQNGNGLSTAQMNLVKQASDSANWLAPVAAEEIGKVLRQILIFESQSYVLTTQLLQTQKQLLAAQVMTNALLIANNQTNEGIMLAKAQGIRPS